MNTTTAPLTGYFIRYRLFGINNTMTFHGMGQYTDWTEVMEENFKEQFEVIGIYSFDY